MNAPLPPDPYKALGVDTSADPASIKTAYRKLVLRCHPDKVLDPTLKAAKQEEFQRVQQAYEILSDDDKRREYDLEVKARKLREELYKNGPATGTPPKKYYNVNIRTAEPPASFAAPQPPPPTKGYSPYPQPQFSHSWESRDMPHRSKAAPFEEKTTRRAASYEKPKREEDSKEERRRRKEEDRERERERERREDRERERERERDREEYLKEKRREEKEDRRREEKRELQRREEKERQRLEDERRAKDIAKAEKKRAEKEREKERDKARRRDQEEKHRSKSKPAYVEPYSDPDDEAPVKTIKKSSSSSKKHTESPQRDKSSRRERDRSTPRVAREDPSAIMGDKLAFAADYMDAARRKMSKAPAASPYHEPPLPTYASPSYPDPEAWHASTPRRGSHDAKYPKAEPVIIDAGSPMHKGPEGLSASPRGEPPIPSLRKSYTSPVGAMPQAPAPAPRIPTLGRAQTMQPDYGRDRPQVPAAPLPDKYSKHSERRRRNSYDDYPEDLHDLPHRSSGHHRSAKGLPPSNVKVYYVEKDDVPRVTERYPDDPYYSGGGGFPKVKVAQQYRPEQVYTAKRYTENDVRYSEAPHTAAPYSQQYAY